MARVEYRVLGTLDVAVDGRQLKLGSIRQRVILVMLLLSANEVLSLSRLIDAVWDETPPETARSQIQICVSALRKQLHAVGITDVIRTQSVGYRLTVADDQLDLKTFERLVAQGRAERAGRRTAEAAGLLRSALACWKGDAVADLDSRVIRSVAARLDEERLAVLEERVELDLELGRHAEIVGELTQLVSQYPLRERLRAQHMLAMYRSGRQAEALESYQALRHILREEMGLEPGKALKELEHAILAEHESIRPPQAPYPPRPVRPNVARQLPATIADFTGRSETLSEIEAFISGQQDSVPVVSICGAGGAGKTALAVRIAHQMIDRFPDGQVFAQLRTGDGQQVGTMGLLERFLRALGGPDLILPSSQEERSATYRSVLGDRKVLLVLDDADSTEQILPLIPGNPDCAVIVTSRRSLLGLYGCQEWELGPLDDVSCTGLLSNVIGAGRVREEIESADELLQLCARLPLAVRIVAAKLANRPHWTIAQMVQRLADERKRLDEITLGNSGIRSCISLSYWNLSKESRTLLLRLGLLGMKDFPVWVGAPLLGLSVPAAEEILATLVEEHLVEISQKDPDCPRFRVHELVRLYAAERAAVDESPEDSLRAIERMLGCWLGLLTEAHRRTYGGDFVILHGNAAHWELPADLVNELVSDPLGWLHAEREGLVATVFHAQRARLDEMCWDLAVTLVTLFESEHLVDDWRSTHEAALEVVRDCGNVRGEAAVLCSLGTLEALEGSAQASEYLKTALHAFAALGDEHGEALALQIEGFSSRLNGDYDLALQHSAQALSRFRRVGDPIGEVDALNNIAQVLLDQHETDRARQLLLEALAKAEELGVGRIKAQTQYRLGEAFIRGGGLEFAADSFRSVIRLCRDGHDMLGEAYGLYGLGSVAVGQQRHAAAETHLVAALELAERLENTLLRGRVLLGFGELDLARGRPGVALARIAAALSLFESPGYPDVWRARALELKGRVHWQAGDTESAASAWRAALEFVSNSDHALLRTLQLALSGRDSGPIRD